MSDRNTVEIAKAYFDWEAFYKKFFGLYEVSLFGVAIPPKQIGFGRLLIIAQGITTQQVFDACQKKFPCHKYADERLDEWALHHERTAKQGSYAIWVRNKGSADEELKSKSANDLFAAKTPIETLPERLIHELVFFQETGIHLDRGSVTLCAGTRDGRGDVPIVDWRGDMLDVRRYLPSYAYEFLRARQVISL